MAARDDRGNGQDPFPELPRSNPIPQRPPLRNLLPALEEEQFEGPFGKTLVEHIVALVTRFDQFNEDAGALGADIIRGFVRLDGRQDLIQAKLNEIVVVLMSTKIAAHASRSTVAARRRRNRLEPSRASCANAQRLRRGRRFRASPRSSKPLRTRFSRKIWSNTSAPKSLPSAVRKRSTTRRRRKLALNGDETPSP